MKFLDWLLDNRSVVWAILFGLSEVLGLIPQVKSSAVMEVVFRFIRRGAGRQREGEK
jgi:hypothetical protein